MVRSLVATARLIAVKVQLYSRRRPPTLVWLDSLGLSTAPGPAGVVERNCPSVVRLGHCVRARRAERARTRGSLCVRAQLTRTTLR